MTEPSMLAGPRLAPASGAPARRLVLLLHGVGADGQDLIALGAQMRRFLPDAAFAAPDGPEPCDMAPVGRQWFSLRDRRWEVMQAEARRTVPVLDAHIDALLAESGLTPDRLAIVGFSQGTMMALQSALRRPEPVGAVVGFSGMLLGSGSLAANSLAPDSLADEIRSRPPVLLIHGEQDEVVPFQAMEAAREGLEAAGVPVEAIARPGLGHTIDPPGLLRAIEFLKAQLPA
jgi:phospholipase/carboxylesterase